MKYKHEFYNRMRRYYADSNFEVWSSEFDYGEGFSADDKIIISFKNKVKVLLLSISKERLLSDEYHAILLALFEDLTDGEGSFELKKIYEPNVDDYDIEDLKKKISSVF